MKMSDQTLYSGQELAAREELLKQDFSFFKKFLGGEKACEAALLHEDPGGLDRLLTHHLGLEGPIESLVEPLQYLLLSQRVERLRIEQEAVHVKYDVRDLTLRSRLSH